MFYLALRHESQACMHPLHLAHLLCADGGLGAADRVKAAGSVRERGLVGAYSHLLEMLCVLAQWNQPVHCKLT